MKTYLTAAVTAASILGIGVASAQLSRTQLEELTGAPYKTVTPSEQKIDPYKVPPGWSPLTFDQRVDLYKGDGTSTKVVLYDEPGGLLGEHLQRFQGIALTGKQVEVRGACVSACTVVVSVVRRENICFGEDASLKFHWASYGINSPDVGKPNYDATLGIYERYPADIRAWIDAKGGIEMMPKGSKLWVLEAPELWKMGYRRCA